MNIKQVIEKNRITLEWAIVDKGTSFFSQGRGNQHFVLERKVWGHSSEIPQRAEKSYVTFWIYPDLFLRYTFECSFCKDVTSWVKPVAHSFIHSFVRSFISSYASVSFSAKRLLCDARLQKNKLLIKFIGGHVLDLGIDLFPLKDEKLNPETKGVYRIAILV